MSDNLKVDASYVDALVENAAWDAARVTIGEKRGDKKGDEGAGKDKGDKPDFTTDARKGDKGKGKDKDDKPDFTTDQRKGDKSKTHPGKKDFEGDDDDSKCESVEEHICPLCESTLDEALTDDQIMEHVAQIQSALETLEEGGEPTDDELDAIENEPDAPSNDDDLDDSKKSKKESVMKKVKELKKSAKGK